MDIYNLTEVDTTMDGKRGVLLQGFNIIGVDGRPLVTLSFETQSEAEAAQKAMLPVVRVAKLITPHVVQLIVHHEARRIAINIAKLPGLKGPQIRRDAPWIRCC
jgi:hypothetical protein